jgi:hypothetical protein
MNLSHAVDDSVVDDLIVSAPAVSDLAEDVA